MPKAGADTATVRPSWSATRRTPPSTTSRSSTRGRSCSRGPRRHAAPAGQRARLAVVVRHHQAAEPDQRRRQAPRSRRAATRRRRATSRSRSRRPAAHPQRRRQRGHGHPRVRRLDLALRILGSELPINAGGRQPVADVRHRPARANITLQIVATGRATRAGDRSDRSAPTRCESAARSPCPSSRGAAGEGHAVESEGVTTASPSGGYLARPRPRAPARQRLPQGALPARGMSQRTEDAMDLGQRLPTGLLRDVSLQFGRAAAGGGAPVVVDVHGRMASVEAAASGARDLRRAAAARRHASRRAPRRTAALRYDATIRTVLGGPPRRARKRTARMLRPVVLVAAVAWPRWRLRRGRQGEPGRQPARRSRTPSAARPRARWRA